MVGNPDVLWKNGGILGIKGLGETQEFSSRAPCIKEFIRPAGDNVMYVYRYEDIPEQERVLSLLTVRGGVKQLSNVI